MKGNIKQNWENELSTKIQNSTTKYKSGFEWKSNTTNAMLALNHFPVLSFVSEIRPHRKKNIENLIKSIGIKKHNEHNYHHLNLRCPRTTRLNQTLYKRCPILFLFKLICNDNKQHRNTKKMRLVTENYHFSFFVFLWWWCNEWCDNRRMSTRYVEIAFWFGRLLW